MRTSLLQGRTSSVYGRIKKIGKEQLPPCLGLPEAPPAPDWPLERGTSEGRGYVISGNILKCGELFSLDASIKRTFRGNVGNRITVLVPSAGFELSCDDRLPVKDTAGFWAVLYIERSGNRLWTLDGPNSIYASRHRFPESELQEVKNVVEANPKRDVMP